MSTTRPVVQQLNRSHGSFELVVSPLILALIGFWIDGQVGTRPVVTIVAAVLGVAGAAVLAYYRYRADMAAVRSSHVEVNDV